MSQTPADGQTVPIVTVDDVRDNAMLVDVRESHEWASGRAPDAVHIPLNELPTRLEEIPTSRPVLVICRSGARSARAVAFLLQQGYDARNVEGGMQDWARRGRPMRHDGPGIPQVI